MIRLCVLTTLAAMLAVRLVEAGETCAQIVEAGKDEQKATLCQLRAAVLLTAEISDSSLADLEQLLMANGVVPEAVNESAGGDVEKRKHEYLRFGKRKHEYLRFGKRKHEYLRFGKRKHEFLRFGGK